MNALLSPTIRCVLPVVVLLAPCHGEAQASPPAAKHHHEEGAGVRSLDVFGQGDRLHVFFAEQREGETRPRLFHRRSDDSGETWSGPIQVDAASPPAFSPHRGMDPQLAAAGDRLIAVWTIAGSDRWGSGPMATALSSDGGQTWKPGPNPADDGSTTGHGFIDITADAAGAFHLTWLDSRDGKQGVRYSRSSDAGATWSANGTVMSETCECCPNTIATSGDGTVGILYRGFDPRDRHLAVSTDGGRHWLQDHRADRFDWKFQGCPHVGGGLAFGGKGKLVHALVWSGASFAHRHLSFALRNARYRVDRAAIPRRRECDASRSGDRRGRPIGCGVGWRSKRRNRDLGCRFNRWNPMGEAPAPFSGRKRGDSRPRAGDARRIPCVLDGILRVRPERLEVRADQAHALAEGSMEGFFFPAPHPQPVSQFFDRRFPKKRSAR